MSQILNSPVIAIIEFNFLTLKNIIMKKILFIAFAAFIFTQCTTDDSSDDALLANMDDVQVETRKNCSSINDWDINEIGLIDDYAVTQQTCPNNCPNNCTTPITECRTFGSIDDCINAADIDIWFKDLIYSQSKCGNPHNGICDPSISLDYNAAAVDTFKLCMNATLWTCQEFSETPPCHGIFECLTGSVTSQVDPMTGLHQFLVNFTNHCNQPINISYVDGQTTQIITLDAKTTESFTIDFSSSCVTLFAGRCNIGTYCPTF